MLDTLAAMFPIAARLKEAREAVSLTQAQLAERIGMSQQSIADIEAGKTERPRKLHEIARAVGKSPEWLLGRAEDAPLKSGGRKPITLEPEEAPRRTIPEIDLRAGASYGGGQSDEEWVAASGTYLVSGDRSIADWGFPSSFIEKELGLSYGFADLVQVRGDSMDDGTARALVSGDRVLIDRKDTDVRQGGVFAIWDGDGVIIKQVELVRGGEVGRIICKSRNSSYDPIHLLLDGNVRVIGRVAGKISRL